MRRRMMMAKAKSQDDFFEPKIEINYNSSVTVGRTTAITFKVSLPVTVKGIVYGSSSDGSNASEAVDRIVLTDSEGKDLSDVILTNGAAIVRGLATVASYNTSVKIEEAREYVFLFVAISVEGKRSRPLTVKITGHE